MPIYGSSVSDPNYRLRFLVIIFAGIAAFGSVLYWRTQALLVAEPVQVPISQHLTGKNLNKGNY